MIPWIQVYSNLPRHPKVTRLADALLLKSACADPNALACGMLVSLWCWAVQNAPDGELSRCSARAVADACLWKRSPESLLNALKETGWLDPDGHIHDWEEYAGLLIDSEARQREKTKERTRRYRARLAARDASCDVTSVACDAPTIPYQTNTEPDNSLLPEERKQKERSALPPFYDGCAGKLIRAKAVIAVMEARRARSRGDEAEARRWADVAEAGGLRVDRETLDYEG